LNGKPNPSSNRLKAGAAEAVITPPVGAPLLGPMRPSTGVHDDLFARVLVLRTGDQAVAVVCLDLVGVDLTLADDLREAIRRRTGIATALVACTHTHSAPFTIPWSVSGWSWLSREGAPWRARLIAAVAETAAEADGKAAEAFLRAGRAPARVGSNRRFPAAAGITMQPYDDGPVVPWTDVLRVDDASARPIAILFTHAAHPVTVHCASTLVSADYPGYAAGRVRAHFGRGCLAMFGHACGANINADPLAAGFDTAEQAGRALGDAVIAAATDAAPLAPAPLLVRSATATLPFSDPPPAAACETEYAKAAAAARRAREDQRNTAGGMLWAEDAALCLQDLLEHARRREPFEGLRFEAQLLAAGREWGLLALTHEVFAEYQLWAEHVSPFRHTMVMGYTNGVESYVPTDAALAAGGYEASGFPDWNAAALWYRNRLALRPGTEQIVKRVIADLVTEGGGDGCHDGGHRGPRRGEVCGDDEIRGNASLQTGLKGRRA
jgi:hypothetical protein